MPAPLPLKAFAPATRVFDCKHEPSTPLSASEFRKFTLTNILVEIPKMTDPSMKFTDGVYRGVDSDFFPWYKTQVLDFRSL